MSSSGSPIRRHGGKRPGAGRPRRHPPESVRVTVALPPADVEHLRQRGGGNLSEGARRVVAADRCREPRKGGRE